MISLAFTGFLVSQSLRLLERSPVGGGGLGGVDENVVLLELLDVGFDLVHFPGVCFHAILLSILLLSYHLFLLEFQVLLLLNQFQLHPNSHVNTELLKDFEVLCLFLLIDY